MVNPELYPFQSRFHHIGDLKYHYLDEGEGPVVVMVHGNPTWSFYFRNLVKHLRASFRIIVPDHMGCGLSDKPNDDRYDYSLKSRVDDLESLLDHLEIRENITLVLHDWGGMIGMAYADRVPERINGLVIMNTAAFFLPQNKTFPPALWLARNTGLGAFLVRGLNAFCRAAGRVCAKRKPLTKELRRAYMAPYDSWANRIAVLRFVQDIPLKPGDRSYSLVQKVQDGLGRFAETPMLICWGERDFVFSTHFLDRWQAYFPQARIHRFADCGHYILEDAKEEILPLISDFLEAHAPVPSGKTNAANLSV